MVLPPFTFFGPVKRLRHYFKNMHCADLRPPVAVRGMTVLDRAAFAKQITVPRLIVPATVNMNNICVLVKKLLLKLENYKPVNKDECKITLHPLAVTQWEDLPRAELEANGVSKDALVWEEQRLEYGNWRYDEILKAVLPEDKESLTSYSKIGHIAHLNLKEHLLPYKGLIGAVLREKLNGCRTVVNKSTNIDNVYRNFRMELLSGDDDYCVTVRENGCAFEFDFSLVYWNPRLSTEHERITKMVCGKDKLYDLYAGVGPFTVPIARKGARVLANDMNSHSYTALLANCIKNKVQSRVQCFEKNAIDFIRQEMREDLLATMRDASFKGDIHVTMNLPALAVEHLVYFVGLLHGETVPLLLKPLVHVYCFAKGVDDKVAIAKALVENGLGMSISDKLKEVAFVRNVSPNKDMMRVSFYLTEDVLMANLPAKRPHPEIDPQLTIDAKRKCNFLSL